MGNSGVITSVVHTVGVALQKLTSALLCVELVWRDPVPGSEGLTFSAEMSLGNSNRPPSFLPLGKWAWITAIYRNS